MSNPSVSYQQCRQQFNMQKVDSMLNLKTGRERKLSGSAGAAGGVASYQPFSASQEPPPPEEKPAPRVKYLYDSFVTALDKYVFI